MKTWLEVLANLVITTCVLLVFHAIGGLTLLHDGKSIQLDDITWSVFGSIMLVVLVFWFAGIVTGIVYAFSVAFTFGLMILAYPFLGWAILKFTAYLMPGTLQAHGFLATLICGWLLLIIRKPSFRKTV